MTPYCGSIIAPVTLDYLTCSKLLFMTSFYKPDNLDDIHVFFNPSLLYMSNGLTFVILCTIFRNLPGDWWRTRK